jgi:hypothetical protein
MVKNMQTLVTARDTRVIEYFYSFVEDHSVLGYDVVLFVILKYLNTIFL